MSDSPSKTESGEGQAETPEKTPEKTPENAPEKPSAFDEAANAMNAQVATTTTPKTAAPADPRPPSESVKPAVEITSLPATTSGMHQQYVAPGVIRQATLNSTKYQLLFIGVAAMLAVFALRGGFLADDTPRQTTTSTALASDDPPRFPNTQNTVPIPKADLTVNAVAIGDTTTPIPRGRDAGANKGGYAQEAADLDAARLMVDKDPTKALAMVDKHDADYPRGIMDPEARVIRVEAYAKKGDDAKALALGNEFLEDYPHSQPAGRVQAIVEALKNKGNGGSPAATP